MLEGLVNKNPDYLARWLQLAALLLETGQLQQALGTMKSFPTLHPRYREGHRVFNQITPEMFKSRPKQFYLFIHRQTVPKNRSIEKHSHLHRQGILDHVNSYIHS